MHEINRAHTRSMVKPAIYAVSAFVLIVLYRSMTVRYLGICSSFTDSVLGVLSDGAWITAIVLISVAVFGIVLLTNNMSNQMRAKVYKFRYVIGFFAVLLLAFFEINLSSLSMWSQTLPDGTFEGLLLGSPRWMRTDEWATSLPMIIGQFANGDCAGYFNDVFRGAPTDMFLSGSSIPTADFSAIFRPFTWGYLLSGLEKGLSIYWCGKAIFLFLVSFDVGKAIFRKSNTFALIFALFTVFAPAACWWWTFSDVAIFAECLFLGGISYFSSTDYRAKILYGILFFWILSCYLWTFYPAWQVPLALVFLILGIAYLLDNKDTVDVSIKRSLLAMIPGLLLFLIGVLYVVLRSHETMELLLGTVYPGQRQDYGGGNWQDLFRYPVYIFAALSSGGLSFDRTDAHASFIDFFPLGLMLAIYVLIKYRKQMDWYFKALFFINTFFLVYYFLGFPAILAKLTLMSFTTAERMVVVLGMVNLMLFVKAMQCLKGVARSKAVICIIVIYAIAIAACSYISEPLYFDDFRIIILIFILLFFPIALYRGFDDASIYMACCIVVVAGVFVNPIQIGTAPATSNQLVRTIAEISSTSNKKWLSLTDWAENIPTLGGASTISSTHYYPDFNLWEILDPGGLYADVYNRYAHMRFSLSAEENVSISLFSEDTVSVSLPVSYLNDLDVGFVVSMSDLSGLSSSNSGIQFVELASYPGFYIYRVESGVEVS